MGKKNKIVKLTPRKIRYIICHKTNGNSTKSTSIDYKISEGVHTLARVTIRGGDRKGQEAQALRSPGRSFWGTPSSGNIRGMGPIRLRT
jgi:hypothetical protein